MFDETIKAELFVLSFLEVCDLVGQFLNVLREKSNPNFLLSFFICRGNNGGREKGRGGERERSREASREARTRSRYAYLLWSLSRQFVVQLVSFSLVCSSALIAVQRHPQCM